MIVIHPPLPFPTPSPLLSLRLHGALLLYDWLATIVRVCIRVCERTRGECTALSLLTVHAAITLGEQHIASDVNSWGRQIYSPGRTIGAQKECVWSGHPPAPTEKNRPLLVLSFFQIDILTHAVGEVYEIFIHLLCKNQYKV